MHARLQILRHDLEDGVADLLVAGLVAEGVVVWALPEDWLGRSFARRGTVRVAAGLQNRLAAVQLQLWLLATGCLASGPGGSQLADPNV